MINQTKKIYIIIVTYNAMPWIEKCLATCKGYPICVIDNASSDKTVAYIRENYPEIQVLPQQKNLGFGQANNIGIRYAIDQAADYVFLLNQDAYLQEGCIEKLIAVHIENPDYGVISPIHLNGQGDQLDEKFLLYLNRDKVTNALLLDAFQNNTSSVYPIEFVNAAGWLLSKQTLQTVGGFDPIFFHYGEDDNYCQRIHYHGF
ncbi:MAG TPA: glycosyltransferase family 2 protein, partial [Flavobacteriaceae bacterium]|nr:glycosyltransferase family 2 protein [Flavobacteriaceae bacterium]